MVMRDRSAFEVTPAMIEAGAAVVFDFRSISDDAELAERVYIAMSAARARRLVSNRDASTSSHPLTS